MSNIPCDDFPGDIPCDDFTGDIPCDDFPGDIPCDDSPGDILCDDFPGDIPCEGMVNLSFLIQIFASDPDEGENGLVQYSFSVLQNMFSLNATNGMITIANNLDYERDKQYKLIVLAQDCKYTFNKNETSQKLFYK